MKTHYNPQITNSASMQGKDTDIIAEHMHTLFKQLVPRMGKADTVAGEIVRAYNRLEYRFFNDGDMVGIGYGCETCNAAARYLMHQGYEYISDYINDLWDCEGDEQLYGEALECLAGAVLDYIAMYPELKTTKNTEDMWDYFDRDYDIYNDCENEWEED